MYLSLKANACKLEEHKVMQKEVLKTLDNMIKKDKKVEENIVTMAITP